MSSVSLFDKTSEVGTVAIFVTVDLQYFIHNLEVYL
jgi:hypothetical protein